ncbi:P-loop containing nucleoside triphosphate hydrolase protein [Biscogniauxia marginata]|nr:P-loop containing nucleoside triphosphate hydrolase protein [Biscogniauxia marginata]
MANTVDDPWSWDVDRVVRELCSPNQTWRSSSSPKLPDPRQLEACLREQEADGHTILTYPDETELFDKLGISTLKHKTTFREFRCQLRQRSQKYKLDQNQSTLDHARKDDVPQPESSHPSSCLPPAREIAESPLGKRRIAPTTVLDETNIDARPKFPEEVIAIGASRREDATRSTWSYLGPDAVTQLDLLDTTAITDEPQEFQGFFSDKRPPGRCLQVNSLLKRYFLKTHDADEDKVLPLYGDSDSDAEYDSETWDEIQQEKRQKAASSTRPPGLGPEEVVAIIDEAIQNLISDWKQRKPPKLLPQASKLWQDARKYGLKKAIEQEHSIIQRYKPRLEKFLLDIQSALWRLYTLRASQEPIKHANPSRATATKAKAAPSPHVREDEEPLSAGMIPQVIDLTQDPDEPQKEHLSDVLVNLDKNLEREIWEFACAFSGHDPAKTDGSNPEHHHSFQGLGVTLRPHQLWAVTRILFMYHFEKTFGILLADGMGVGKTLEGSCGVILTPHIHLAAQEVRQDRKRGRGRHLPASTPEKQQPCDSECPSGTYIRGFACLCVERLPTAQLIASHTLPRGPAIILVPPGLREQWYEQLCKYVSPELLSDGIRNTEIWSVHTSADNVQSAIRRKYNRVKFITARDLQKDEVTDDQWEWRQEPDLAQQTTLKLGGKRNDDNNHIIMIMPTSSTLTNIQKESTLIVEYEERDVLEPFFIKPAWIVMDEAHNQVTENTLVGRFITKKLIKRSASPSYLVCMSGTPIRRSPLSLKPFFTAITSPTVQGWKEPPGYNPLDDFNAWAKESDWLVSYRGDAESADATRRTTYEKRFQNCKRLGKVLQPYMIQRHSHDDFFGFPVIPLPATNVVVVSFSNFPGRYLEDIRRLVNMSREQLSERLQKKLDLWRAANRRGSRPTIEDVISEIDRGFGNQGCFYDLGLCATFPALASMLLSGEPLRFRIGDIQSNVNAISDADLRGHILWPYFNETRHGSEKMDFIEQKIKDMCRDDEQHRDGRGARQALRKKMIIFTISPITALLIALVLRKELPAVRQTLVLASDAPAKRATLYAPFCCIGDGEMSDNNDPNDPLILITTARVSGEGFNMTRANYAIMAEPPFARQVEEQAFRRVHRHGQQATTHLFSLYSSWNPVEVIVRGRQDVRAKLLDEAIWTLPGATTSLP